MGTHPIFESDFDCLTDCLDQVMNIIRSFRSLSVTGNLLRQPLPSGGQKMAQTFERPPWVKAEMLGGPIEFDKVLKERDFESKWEAERLIRESKQKPSTLKAQRKKFGSTQNVVKRKKTGVVHWINF